MPNSRVGIVGLGPQGSAHLAFVDALDDADVATY